MNTQQRIVTPNFIRSYNKKEFYRTKDLISFEKKVVFKEGVDENFQMGIIDHVEVWGYFEFGNGIKKVGLCWEENPRDAEAFMAELESMYNMQANALPNAIMSLADRGQILNQNYN